MENFKNQKSGWPIPLFYGIESSDFLKNCPSPKQVIHSKKKQFTMSSTFPKMSTKIYSYIFNICDSKGYHPSTKHHTIHLLHKYIEKKGINFNDDMQLIALICLWISSKLFEVNHLKVEDLHKLSNHSFTNKDLINGELKVLEALKYKIFYKKYLLSEKLELFLLLLSSLHPSDKIEDLVRVSNLILDLLYENITIFDFFTSSRAIIASILHSSLLVLTQYNGRFPMTWRMSMITKIPEEEIISGSLRILKHILPKEFRKMVKLD